MTNFVVEFSEHRSEEVMFLLTLSVLALHYRNGFKSLVPEFEVKVK